MNNYVRIYMQKVRDMDLLILIVIGIIFLTSMIIIFYRDNSEKSFMFELKKIKEEYRYFKDPKEYFEKLTHMEHKAKTKKSKDALYYNISIALTDLEKYQDAVIVLNKINSKDEDILKNIERQKRIIRNRRGN